MTSYLPATVDGSEIPAESPRSMGMSDVHAAEVSARAEEFRGLVLHCHFDLSGRELVLYAANAPEGPVLFSFGDGSGDVTEQVTGEGGSASASHAYGSDGVFEAGVRAGRERWFTEVAVNWPPYQEEVVVS
jgi:hypothetical protein